MSEEELQEEEPKKVAWQTVNAQRLYSAQARIQRTQRISELWRDLRGKTAVFIEYKRLYGPIAYPTVAKTINELQRRWREERDDDVSRWRDEELQYALDARAYARKEFMNNPKHPISYGRLEGEWTLRIAALMGLDAPKKIDTSTTDKSWREMLSEYAKKEGISEDEAKKRLLNEVNDIANGRLESVNGTVLEGEVKREPGENQARMEANSSEEREPESPTDGI
jgi:hypothetical protein